MGDIEQVERDELTEKMGDLYFAMFRAGVEISYLWPEDGTVTVLLPVPGGTLEYILYEGDLKIFDTPILMDLLLSVLELELE